MLVSMIYYTSEHGTKRKIESVFADSVRTLIVNELQDGQEKKFSQITKAVEKKDNVVSRELNGLIARGWVIKIGSGFTSRYKLDVMNEDVVNYMKHSEIAISGNSEINEVKTSLDVPYKNVCSNDPDYISSVLHIKEDIANHILKYIKVNIVGEKIDGYNANREFTLTGEEFVEIAHIMNRIISKRAWYYVRKDCKKNPELKSDKVEFYKKTCTDLRQKSWKKSLKLIISYTPDQINEDDLLYLAKNTLL